MNIIRKCQPRMKLAEFADKHGLEIEVVERGQRRPIGVACFYARFIGCEVLIDGRFLLGEVGNGETEYEAIADYAKRISSTRIVVNAMSLGRREIDVPILEYVL